MRPVILALLFLLVGEVWVQAPEYEYSRRWVEEHNPNDQTPAADRIFVAYSNDYTAIVPFREGIVLRDIIDQTKAKGKKVRVRILRSTDKISAVFDEVVTPSDKPAFSVKRRDVVWLTDVEQKRKG
jgi:hypothetical protein